MDVTEFKEALAFPKSRRCAWSTESALTHTALPGVEVTGTGVGDKRCGTSLHCWAMSQHRAGSFSFCRQSPSQANCRYRGCNPSGLFKKEGRNKTWEMRNCLEKEGTRKGSSRRCDLGRSARAVKPTGRGAGGGVIGVLRCDGDA